MYTGTEKPRGETPWLTVTFVDTTVDGTAGVLLTMNADNLVGDEFVTNWYFNFGGDLDTLTFKYISGTSASVSQGSNNFEAPGGGLFDILFSFNTSNGKNSNSFTGGDSVYLITGATSAQLFNALSTPKGSSNGPFLSVAHVQNNASAHIAATPIPAAAWLLGSGLVGLLGIRMRRRRG